MSSDNTELVTGGNVVNPELQRKQAWTRARRKIAFFGYGICTLDLLFWVFATYSTITHGFLQFDFGVIIIGFYSAISLIFVVSAGLRR